MNFASLTFWFSLIGAFTLLSLLRFLLRGVFVDRWAFIGLSLFLLGMESLETVAVFLWVVGVGYLGLKAHRRWSLVLVGCLLLVPLGYYKYSGFFEQVFLGREQSLRLLIPMGLSFYTFQIFSFVIDSRREGLDRPRFLDFLNYASFFPQIVAGPIERRSDLLPQVQNLSFGLKRKDIEDGLPWIVLGLFFKLVMAENFALLGDELRSFSTNSLIVWFDALFFAFRIYFDFCGYSLIAFGLASCFGIKLTLNFRSPYLARNIQDFWRQWHVTLSRWFRDYVYFPLGGSRVRLWFVNVCIVFLLSGLWHGAGWGFLIWGLLHGVAVLVCVLSKKKRLPYWLAWSLTIAFVTVSWIFFKESDWRIACQKVEALAFLKGYHLNASAILACFEGPKTALLAGFMAVLTAAVFVGEFFSQRKSAPYGLLLNRWVQLLLIAAICFLSPTRESAFIYFNF